MIDISSAETVVCVWVIVQKLLWSGHAFCRAAFETGGASSSKIGTSDCNWYPRTGIELAEYERFKCIEDIRIV